MAEPQYSNTEAGAAADPDARDQRQNNVLGRDARLQRPIHSHLIRFRTLLQQALRRQHVLHFAGADAERQRAQMLRASRCGCRRKPPSCRAASIPVPARSRARCLACRCPADSSGCRNPLQFWISFVHLRGGDLVHDRQPARRGRRAVIRGRDREIGPPHLQPARAQTVEGLRRRDFVHQVQIDVDQRRRVRRAPQPRGCPRSFR